MDDSPSDDNRPDAYLIKDVLNGDKDRYRVLVDRHRELVFAIIYRQVGDRALASELSQETFVKAYLGLKSFRYAAKFSSWLTRIALNVTNSYFSSKAFRQQQLHESFEVQKHDMSGHEITTEDMAELKLKHFRRALAQLKQPLRDVLTLCALDGKSYEEAATILEIPIGTIRSRLNTARLKLKDAIAAEIERSLGHES